MAAPKADRTCHCGYRRGDAAIHEEPEYTTWGWIMLSMFGMTPRPNHIAFRCALCRQTIGKSRDPRLLARRSVDEKPRVVDPSVPSRIYPAPQPVKIRA